MTAHQKESASAEKNHSVLARLSGFWSLTKFKQTLLLLVTGACGYIITKPQAIDLQELLLAALALYLSVSGCTALNMVFDRDVDAKMSRTAHRPLPRGTILKEEAFIFGVILSCAGLGLAWLLRPVFGLIVTLGFLVDLFVYTLWLKRLTPFSILWGGVSGGMPAMAGRVLACGRVDVIGILFALSILLWIPSHILTLIMYHAQDYEKAKLPVWPTRYGLTATRRLIAGATLLNALVFTASGLLLDIHYITMAALACISIIITGIAIWCALSQKKSHDFALFKAASLYMLFAFALLTAGSFLK